MERVTDEWLILVRKIAKERCDLIPVMPDQLLALVEEVIQSRKEKQNDPE